MARLWLNGQDVAMSAGDINIPALFASMWVEVADNFDQPIETVWALVSDVERMAGLGPEHVEASWVGDGRRLGAQFIGKNCRGDMTWEVPCWVTEWEDPRRFAWTVLEPENPSSRWSYTLAPKGAGTLVEQRFEHGPNYSFTRLWAEERPQEAETIIRERSAVLEADMKATLVNAAHLLDRQASERPNPVGLRDPS